MKTALDITFTLAAVFLVTWIAIFGGLGALLATVRGSTAGVGFLWGVLGPPGLGVILWQTRRASRTVDAGEYLGEEAWPDPADEPPLDAVTRAGGADTPFEEAEDGPVSY